MDDCSLSFGRFQFDTRLGRLTGGGHKIRLQPKPAAVLCRLLRTPGEVVSRDDLRKALWPEGTHVDFYLGIKVVIQKLRAALGDVFEEPTYIQTIPGGGYRFIAPVTAVEPDTIATPVSVEGVSPLPAEQRRNVRRRRYLARAGAVAAGLAV